MALPTGVEPASLCLGDLRRGGGRPPGADGGARRLAAGHGFAREHVRGRLSRRGGRAVECGGLEKPTGHMHEAAPTRIHAVNRAIRGHPHARSGTPRHRRGCGLAVKCASLRHSATGHVVVGADAGAVLIVERVSQSQVRANRDTRHRPRPSRRARAGGAAAVGCGVGAAPLHAPLPQTSHPCPGAASPTAPWTRYR